MKGQEKIKYKFKSSTLYLVLLAVLTAATACVTVFIPIPMPIMGGMGYLNFGDTVIFAAAILLGPVGGAVVGGLGSMIADLFVAPMYAPFTLVIKALEGFVAALSYRYLFTQSKKTVRRIIAMLLGGTVMMTGYFFTEIILVNVYAALPTLLVSLIQIAGSMVIALIILPKAPDLFTEEITAGIDLTSERKANDKACKKEEDDNSKTSG